MRNTRVIWILGILGAVVVATTVFHSSLIKTTIAMVVAAGLMRVGWTMIGGLAEPVPEPPEPGELRKVKLVYRCGSCGAEVRMTAAASEHPDAPRHCMDDMELMTPLE